MKIYLAGNTPDRFKQEIDLFEKGLYTTRLLSYICIVKESAMWKILKYYEEQIK